MGTNVIVVSELVVKATYKANRPYAMIQNIYPRDAIPLISMVPLIAIAFQHIYFSDPIILFAHIRKLSTAAIELEATHKI